MRYPKPPKKKANQPDFGAKVMQLRREWLAEQCGMTVEECYRQIDDGTWPYKGSIAEVEFKLMREAKV